MYVTSAAWTDGLTIGGVDTHRDTHHAAVIDQVGRHLADAEFPATPAGYRHLLEWLAEHGRLERVGVEGTGAYGAALTRFLRERGVAVVEVDRPDRKDRRTRGKSDPIDAYAAARAALSGAASGHPKARDGRVEAIRVLRVVRRGAVKARTQTMNQLKGLIVTAPADLRESLRGLPTAGLIATCARLRPGSGDQPAAVMSQCTKLALRRLARRYQQLSREIAELDAELQPLVRITAPAQVGPVGAGRVDLVAQHPRRSSAWPPRTGPARHPDPPEHGGELGGCRRPARTSTPSPASCASRAAICGSWSTPPDPAPRTPRSSRCSPRSVPVTRRPVEDGAVR
jgi:transposase